MFLATSISIFVPISSRFGDPFIYRNNLRGHLVSGELPLVVHVSYVSGFQFILPAYRLCCLQRCLVPLLSDVALLLPFIDVPTDPLGGGGMG